ncbi:MAG: putative ATP-dependent Na+ efflux pump [Bacteroidetes bacterium]|jgi:ABC-2 type transport system permease protein|nr:putative ATP-dependent Na+ efflux pump [Bacteroidota bacterium]
MIRRRKVWAVTAFEFLSEVRKVGFLVGVFGMPIILLAYGALMALVGILSESGTPRKHSYGVVNQAGVAGLDSAAERVGAGTAAEMAGSLEMTDRNIQLRFSEKFTFRPFPDEQSAMASLKAKEIDGWYLLLPDYMSTGNVVSYAAESEGLTRKEPESALRELLRRLLLQGAVPAELLRRAEEPLTVSKSWLLKSNGELIERGMAAMIAQFAVPLVFAILLFIAIIGTGMSLVQGTAIEKENRVVDVLLSSATADEIMAGKLLGQGGAGLLQVSAWFGMAGLSGILFAAQLAPVGITIAWGPLIVGIVYFIATYFFLGSLLLGTGALGSNFKEGQQWSLLWILLTALPMAFLASFIRDPHSTLAKVFTWFPFSASWVVTFRFWMDPSGMSAWEVAGPLLVLALCTWISVRIGARLLRLGLLLTGSRATPAEVLRQMRLNP